jgi:hypothetical protein
LQENERLKQELRRCREANAAELESLKIDYDEAADFYNGGLEKIKRLKQKNEALMKKTEELKSQILKKSEMWKREERRKRRKRSGTW